MQQAEKRNDIRKKKRKKKLLSRSSPDESKGEFGQTAEPGFILRQKAKHNCFSTVSTGSVA